MNRARDIEKVEVDYLVKKSNDRLGTIRKGGELMSVIEKQKLNNHSSLKGLNQTR